MREDRWELTAPESYVLLNGPKGSGKDAFKLALLEVIARRALVIQEAEQQVLFGRKNKQKILARVAMHPRINSRSLLALLELYDTTSTHSFSSGHTGIPVAIFARVAVVRFKSLDGYVESEVLPVLVERGLYQREEGRVLWVFPTTNWTPTEAGKAEKARLESHMTSARSQLSGSGVSNNAQTFAVLAGAGSAVLLMNDVYPQLERTRELQRQTSSGDSGGDGGSYIYSTPAEDDEEDEGGQESDGLDLDLSGISFDFDFDVLGEIGDAFDAIDSGVDAGGGDGGDGGGDGGGGGGD